MVGADVTLEVPLGTVASTSIGLELKSIADIGLVGLPNAGKSSLLAALSRLKPEIADYPFTTVRPNVGTIFFDDISTARMADIPGLIEGASQNLGMGHSFLRHIERTSMLLFVVDIGGFQLSQKSSWLSAIDAVELLLREIEMYQVNLLKRPALLAVNKVDRPEAALLYQKFQHELRERLLKQSKGLNIQHVIPISVHSGHGLDVLKATMEVMLGKIRSNNKNRSQESFEDRLLR